MTSLVVRRAAPDSSVAQAVGRQLGALAASAVAGKCPLCTVRPATTKVRIGPVFTEVCDECSKPIWHTMGLLSWFQGAFRRK